MIYKGSRASPNFDFLGGFYRFSSCSLCQLLHSLRNKMAPPAGPYSGTSTLALVARASAFSLGLVCGSIKLRVLKDVPGKRNFYTKAYLGLSSKQVPKFWLIFQVSVPPLGWNTYFISRRATRGKNRNGFFSMMDSPQNETIEIGPGDLKMSFSVASGQLQRMYDSTTGVDVPIQQSFLWYNSSSEIPGSGAYIFRPESFPKIVSRSVNLKVFRGPLVDEIHQEFSSWIYQLCRYFSRREQQT